MKCSQCAQDIPSGAAFCPQCGAKLTQGVAASSTGAARMKGAGRPAEQPEQELWTGSYSPKAMVGPLLGAVVLLILGMVAASFAGPAGWMIGWIAVGIGAALVFGYLGILLLYRRMSIHYRLTSHRLVLQRGILSRTDDRILLVDIDDITVRQGFIERMFDLGTITLHTSDETTKEQSPDPNHGHRGVLEMKGIENPRQVGDLIDETRRTERSKRGLYMMNA